MRLNKHLPQVDWRLALCALAVAILLTACGGGSSQPSSSSGGNGGGSATVTAFPTGVALSSPTALGDSSEVVAAAVGLPWDVRLADWGRAMWQAIAHRDLHTASALIMRVMPIPSAHAATSKTPEGVILASKIEAVAAGRLALASAGITLADLFQSGSANNAACFGPGIDYTTHDDWTYSLMDPDADGSLPTGDLGMWLSSSTDNFGPGIGTLTQPCAAAQLSMRLDGTKKQVLQAMLLMAGMRRLIEASSTLDMPAAGASTDLQSPFSTVVAAVPALSGVTVDAASVALDSGAATYTYRLTLSTGSGSTAKQGEIIIQHTPGGSSTQFTGVIQVTAGSVSSDAAFGCDDAGLRSGAGTLGDPYQYDVATVTTIRYDRNGTALSVGARAANYCGEINTSAMRYIDDIAALDGDGMLDLSVDLGGGSTRGSTKGWRGNASRFGATLNTATQAGDFLYIWQAGNNDSHSRAFTVHSDYNSSTEARTLDAFYAFADNIATTNGDLLGMICNWAGPGGVHTPQPLFQSQQITLAASASVWSESAARLTYAPTNSCDASGTMRFDADASGSIDTAGNEGASVAHDLDALSGGNTTVAQEMVTRGVTKPTLY